MQSTTRRRFQATAGILVAGSLIGVQVLAAPANASGTVTWRPGTPPNGATFWSDTCSDNSKAPVGTPTSIPTDANSQYGTETFVASQAGLPDAAWQFQTASGTEGGPAAPVQTSTTAVSIAVNGATDGRLVVAWADTSGASVQQYLGVKNIPTTSAGWQSVGASSTDNLTWYTYVNILGSLSWQPVSILNSGYTNSAMTLAGFFSKQSVGSGGAAIELGCSGSFAIDHLKVTDGPADITDYDLQNPLSSTTTSTTVAKVGPGGSATINGAVVSDSSPVTTGTVTLQSSTNGGTTWTTGTTQATGTGFTVAPTQTTLYKVNFNGAPEAAASTSSNTVTVQVGPRVTLRANRSTMNVGQAATFTATFAPVRAGITVTFQQLSGTTWQWLGSAVTNSSGVATLTKTRTPSGLWSVRALSTAQQGYTASTVSATTAIKVYQPVSITAYRSVSSVYVGRYFRIYGTVSPHLYGIGLQLQQYLGGRWVVVATGHSGTRGVYSFSKLARTVGVATFRVVAPASGYRRLGGSAAVRVTIVRAPVYTPPPPPPPSGGGGGGGSGIG